jgi:NADP-dependent 3-hydroxy acid dehydrogenase YdfG
MKYDFKGAYIVLACRNIEKTQIAAKSIINSTKNTNIFIEKLNLKSFNSIEDFAERIKSKFKCIDMLINNAGKINFELRSYNVRYLIYEILCLRRILRVIY